MTGKRERLEAAIAGEIADRPPVALWRHFPVDDQDPELLADATVAFQREYDFDFVKVTPSSSFCLKDWGSMDRWEGSDQGTRTYTHRVVEKPEDWAELAPLPSDEGYLGDQLDCLRRIVDQLGPEVPVIQTIFSPLAQAKNLAGQDRLMEHLHVDPEAVARGLRVIEDSTVNFVEALSATGVAGTFYAIQHASYRLFDRETYAEYAEPGDLRILEAASDMWLNVLHLHGEAIHFELAERYPAQIVNWHAQTVDPSLVSAAASVPGAVCGGLRREATLVLGDPKHVQAEARRALDKLEGRGLVLGAGCVVPIKAPRANLKAARASVENFA
ncbi:MAG: uroporphyrinogen decarboxylase family protein [Anaerolineales bacterium]|nr:uroporphyrinogen decarboxylase family protein [Anaerolineales bacterium]